MAYYGYNDARKKANEKYLKNKVDNIMVRPPKGTKDTLTELAAARNMSLNAAMKKIIEYAIDHPEILDN